MTTIPTVLAVASHILAQTGGPGDITHIAPSSQGIPGATTLQKIISVAKYAGLFAAVAGGIGGLIMWGVSTMRGGVRSGNEGVRALGVALTVAILVGIIGSLVFWAYNLPGGIG
jgi:hypothetical protein